MAKIFDFIRQVYSGKTISRILFNWQVKENCRNLTGVCVDLASGGNPSYQRYWKLNCDKLIRSEYQDKSKPDIIIDLNKKIPLADNFANNIFLFNALYILKNPEESLKDVNKVLKSGGNLFLSSPFIANEMPEPDDYFRFTSQRLKEMLTAVGFVENKIVSYGERFTAVVYLLHDFFVFNSVRLVFFSLALLADKIIPKKMRNNHPCPIGYFVMAKKPNS